VILATFNSNAAQRAHFAFDPFDGRDSLLIRFDGRDSLLIRLVDAISLSALNAS
jgi:hypothetical protein